MPIHRCEYCRQQFIGMPGDKYCKRIECQEYKHKQAKLRSVMKSKEEARKYKDAYRRTKKHSRVCQYEYYDGKRCGDSCWPNMFLCDVHFREANQMIGNI